MCIHNLDQNVVASPKGQALWCGIAQHLSSSEIDRRYREATDVVERSHYQIIWLSATGKTLLSATDVIGYNRFWSYQVVPCYNEICSGCDRAFNEVKNLVKNPCSVMSNRRIYNSFASTVDETLLTILPETHLIVVVEKN